MSFPSNRTVTPEHAMTHATPEIHADDAMPGEAIASRPLNLIFVLDCSGSMGGEKMASLNHAMAEALDALRATAADNPSSRILVRAIAFQSAARWHVAQPTPIESFVWQPLQADGTTDMAGAISLLTDALDISAMPPRGLPPVLVLVTDGQPDDPGGYERMLQRLHASPWGGRGVRVGIGIGHDVQVRTLERFINNPEIPVLFAHNAAELALRLRWATVAMTQAVSMPRSQIAGRAGSLAVPPPVGAPTPLGPAIW